MEIKKEIENSLTKLVEEHIELHPVREHHDIKEVYHTNKTAILNLANSYINIFNELPYIRIGSYKK